MRYNVGKDFNKLKKAGIDTFGLTINVTSNQNVKDFFIGDDDTMKYVHIELILQNHIFKEDEEFIEEYGRAYGKLITTYDQVSGRLLDYSEVIDSIDDDACNCLSVFMNKNGEYDDELAFQQFFYLERLMISKEYRGHGLGSILLEYIKCKYVDFDTAIVLQPLAFEHKEESPEVYQKESERLCQFYERHGFVKYRDDTWVYHEY